MFYSWKGKVQVQEDENWDFRSSSKKLSIVHFDWFLISSNENTISHCNIPAAIYSELLSSITSVTVAVIVSFVEHNTISEREKRVEKHTIKKEKKTRRFRVEHARIYDDWFGKFMGSWFRCLFLFICIPKLELDAFSRALRPFGLAAMRFNETWVGSSSFGLQLHPALAFCSALPLPCRFNVTRFEVN